MTQKKLSVKYKKSQLCTQLASSDTLGFTQLPVLESS